jgi:hypothetical protein
MEGSMVAGRELDALVAERVLGWKLIDRIEMGWGEGPDVWDCTNGKDADECYSPTRQHFAPSTDISAAWAVVERMRENGMWMKLTGPFYTDAPLWNAGFTPHGMTGFNGRPDFCGHGDTAPLAICRAALAALTPAAAEGGR